MYRNNIDYNTRKILLEIIFKSSIWNTWYQQKPCSRNWWRWLGKIWHLTGISIHPVSIIFIIIFTIKVSLVRPLNHQPHCTWSVSICFMELINYRVVFLDNNAYCKDRVQQNVNVSWLKILCCSILYTNISSWSTIFHIVSSFNKTISDFWAPLCTIITLQ